jgi:oligoribonuclease (3'-5' exoribonuclease)
MQQVTAVTIFICRQDVLAGPIHSPRLTALFKFATDSKMKRRGGIGISLVFFLLSLSSAAFGSREPQKTCADSLRFDLPLVQASSSYFNRLAWINLETTDLDPANSFPLEIAVIVTDENLEPIGEFTRVIYQPAENLSQISGFAREMHTENGLLNEVSVGKSTEEVERDLLAFLDSYHWPSSGGSSRIKVAGTNPSFDVAWIQKFFPKLYPKLDHHLFDVIPLREAFQLITGYKADRSFGRDRVQGFQAVFA